MAYFETHRETVTPARSVSRTSRLKLLLIPLILLIAGVGLLTGLNQFRQDRDRPLSLLECQNYEFTVSPEGRVTATNFADTRETPQTATIFINDEPVPPTAGFAVESIPPGQTRELGSVPVPGNEFTWRVETDRNCRDSGTSTLAQADISPTAAPAPETRATPSPTPRALSQAASPTSRPSTPTPAPVSGACNSRCTADSSCAGGLVCYFGSCRHPDRPVDPQCLGDGSAVGGPAPLAATQTPAPTPTPAVLAVASELPESGNFETTIMILSAGFTSLLIGLLLFL